MYLFAITRQNKRKPQRCYKFLVSFKLFLVNSNFDKSILPCLFFQRDLIPYTKLICIGFLYPENRKDSLNNRKTMKACELQMPILHVNCWYYSEKLKFKNVFVLDISVRYEKEAMPMLWCKDVIRDNHKPCKSNI